MEQITCGECRFFHDRGKRTSFALRDNGVRFGECRRHPPRFGPYEPDAMGALIGYWPEVELSEWCGEAQLKPEKNQPVR